MPYLLAVAMLIVVVAIGLSVSLVGSATIPTVGVVTTVLRFTMAMGSMSISLATMVLAIASVRVATMSYNIQIFTS